MKTNFQTFGRIIAIPLIAFIILTGMTGASAQTTNISGSLSVGSSNSISGTNSVAIGLSNTITGNNSLALGISSKANGSNSFSAGSSIASGIFSSALNYSTANGNYSLAANMGQATNTLSSAIGYGTVTGSPIELVVGIFNKSVGKGESVLSSTNGYYIITDSTAPLFVIGNGSSTNFSNALQVRKDGKVLINPSGDLSMGSYTNGPTP